MRQLLLLLVATTLCLSVANAQEMTLESLKSMKADKQAAIDGMVAELADLENQILTFPGWKIGGLGSIGFDGIRNNDWFALSNANSANYALNLGLRGFARLDNDDLFWDNGLKVNLARVGAFIDKDIDTAPSKSVALTNNALELSSIFGKKIAPKWALSAELNWLSTVVERETDIKYNFALNQPGQATFSLGLTWLPITNLKVNIHPLGYQKNWPGALSSMAGAKIGATYTAEILPNVNWDSNLGAFIPYTGAGDVAHAFTDAAGVAGTQNVAYETADLANWKWINTFSTKIWRGIGVVAEVGLAGNRQIADLARVASGGDGQTDISDNPLQSYYSLGLGYTF